MNELPDDDITNIKDKFTFFTFIREFAIIHDKKLAQLNSDQIIQISSTTDDNNAVRKILHKMGIFDNIPIADKTLELLTQFDDSNVFDYDEVRVRSEHYIT